MKQEVLTHQCARLLMNILAEQRRVEVWQHNAPMQVLSMHDFLEGLDVLPGFVWPVRDLL